MNEVTETASNAALSTIEPTTGFAEIRNGGELAVDGPGGVPAGIERVAGFLGRIFVFEARVDVADQMIIVIITNDYLLNLPKLAHLTPEILVECVKVVLQLRCVHLVFGIVGGVLVQVGQKDGLAVRGLDMLAGTAVAVAAGADFVVEGTVDFVGLSAEDAGEVVGHFEG
jgi:hypothetical protein